MSIEQVDKWAVWSDIKIIITNHCNNVRLAFELFAVSCVLKALSIVMICY